MCLLVFGVHLRLFVVLLFGIGTIWFGLVRLLREFVVCAKILCFGCTGYGWFLVGLFLGFDCGCDFGGYCCGG